MCETLPVELHCTVVFWIHKVTWPTGSTIHKQLHEQWGISCLWPVNKTWGIWACLVKAARFSHPFSLLFWPNDKLCFFHILLGPGSVNSAYFPWSHTAAAGKCICGSPQVPSWAQHDSVWGGQAPTHHFPKLKHSGEGHLYISVPPTLPPHAISQALSTRGDFKSAFPAAIMWPNLSKI